MQIDLLAGVDLGLAIQWKVIAILADQNMRQQARARHVRVGLGGTAVGLRERLAAGAGHARAHDLADDKVSGDVFQFLRHILAKRLERAAAIAAGVARGQNLFCRSRWSGSGARLCLRLPGWSHRPDRRPGRISLLGRSGRGDLNVFLQIERQLIQASDLEPNRALR